MSQGHIKNGRAEQNDSLYRNLTPGQLAYLLGFFRYSELRTSNGRFYVRSIASGDFFEIMPLLDLAEEWKPRHAIAYKAIEIFLKREWVTEVASLQKIKIYEFTAKGRAVSEEIWNLLNDPSTATQVPQARLMPQ